MESTFRNLLDNLTKELTIINSPILNWMQEGISRDLVEAKLKTYNIKFPNEVYDLYEWKDGIRIDELETRTLGELQLFKLGIYPPFNIASDDYINYTSVGYWSINLFPLFGSGGGDYYLIDCNKSSLTYSMIYYYSSSAVDFERIITAYDSLPSLFSTVIDCYMKKAYYLDEDFSLEVDFEMEKNISKVYNPKSDYWRIIA